MQPTEIRIAKMSKETKISEEDILKAIKRDDRGMDKFVRLHVPSFLTALGMYQHKQHIQEGSALQMGLVRYMAESYKKPTAANTPHPEHGKTAPLL